MKKTASSYYIEEQIKKPENSGKIYACLMAGAIGDALGYPVEFDSYKAIQNNYGFNGICEPVLSGEKAIISDDTQMTLFTNDAMVRAYRYEAEKGISASIADYVYLGYLCWLETQSYEITGKQWSSILNGVPEMNHRRAPGNTCLNALLSGKMGTLETPINQSKGCGGVMRTAPLGFDPRWGNPLENGAKCAAITHGHPMGWIPAGMLSDIVYKSIYCKYNDLESLIRDSLADTKKTFGSIDNFDKYEEMLINAIELSHIDCNDESAICKIGAGWVGDEALAIAVFSCLKHPNDLKACLISAVNHSGDSDSTGAIAGNILGAWLGADCIPKDWEEKTELCNVIKEEASAMVKCLCNK